MELTKKTTILLSPDLHRLLARLARQEGVSIGELVRNACVKLYGLESIEARLEAVRKLGRLSLPVDDVQTIKKDSVPKPREIEY